MNQWACISGIERRCQCILDPVDEDEGETTIIRNVDDSKLMLRDSGGRRACVDWKSLQSRCWQTRREAVSRLGFCSQDDADGKVSAEVLIALRAALKDGHWQVRRQSAYTLQELGEVAVHEALPALWQACADRDACVRAAALSVLHFYGQDAPSHRLRAALPAQHATADDEMSRLACVIEDESEMLWECPRESFTGQSDDTYTGMTRQSTEEGGGSATDTDGIGSRMNTEETNPDQWERPSMSISAGPSTSKSCCVATMVRRAAGDHQSAPLGDTPASSQIKMLLGKPAGAKLGVKCAASLSGPLRVLEVEEGIVRDWNRGQSPERQLCAGDHITAVNSVEGDSGANLMAILSSDCKALEVIFTKMHVELEQTGFREVAKGIGNFKPISKVAEGVGPDANALAAAFDMALRVLIPHEDVGDWAQEATAAIPQERSSAWELPWLDNNVKVHKSLIERM